MSNTNIANQIVMIGFIGVQRCYIGVTEEEARKRYERDGASIEEEGCNVRTIRVIDGEFEAYDLWEVR